MYTTQNNRQIDREIVYREEEDVGTDTCIQHKTLNRQLDREEEEGTDRCIQHRIIVRQRDSLQHKTIDR